MCRFVEPVSMTEQNKTRGFATPSQFPDFLYIFKQFRPA